MALQANFDIILMDMQMPKLGGIEATQRQRERGYSGTIAAFTTFDSKDEYDRLMQSGFDYCLTKPHTKESLELLLAALQDQPLTSTMADNGDMAEFIQAFVDDVTQKISLLENALATSNVEELTLLIEQIKGAGGTVGFDEISALAGSVLKVLQRSDNIAEVHGDILGLIRLCRRVRASGLPGL